MASKRTREIAGAAAGVGVGAGASAAVGYGVSKAVGALAVRGGGFLVPGIGWVAAGVTAASAVYGAVSAGRETAKSGGSFGDVVKSSALGAVGITPAMAKDVGRAIKGDEEQQRLDRAEKEVTRFDRLRKAAEARGDTKAAKDASEQSARWQARADDAKAQKKPTASATPPPGAADPAKDGSLLSDIKGMFARNPQLVQREADLRRTRQLLEKNLEKEQGSGFGPRSEAAKRALEENTNEMKSLAKEERDNNAFGKAFQDFAPFGALLGGIGLGTLLSGANKIASGGNKAVGEISRLAGQADKLTSKSGLLAGTVSGDRARAAVESARTAVDGMGKLKVTDYAWPAFNLAAGGGELAYGYTHDRSDPTVQSFRIGGALELGFGLGQLKAVTAAASGIRASATAIAKLRGAEMRIARETAAGAGKASRAKVGGQIARARGGEKMARNATAARVSGSAVTRDTAAIPQAQAGARLGAARADAKGTVGVARNSAKRDVIRSEHEVRRARQNANAPAGFGHNDNARGSNARRAYKNTWTDSRGRTYQRRDMSVRVKA